MEKQIFQQRIRFLFIDLAAVLLFALFSWFFTGILLRPIQESHQRQTHFIAAASHELRTPLAVILSSAECFKNVDSAQQDSFLNTIRQEGLRMSRLIEDMLTLTESDIHRFSIQKNPVELDTLLLNTCEAFEVLAKEHSLSLSLALPDTPLPMCICDPDRIRQVISILLHNAVSYTQAQGKIRVSLTHKRASGKANFFLSVSDNGIGISDEDKKKIFDRFFRAEKSRSAKGHFGLGLSIAFEIVHAHHGNITVADSKEGGSVFTVCLPEK